ncbi:MAG: nucleoside hydrolase [Synergistaceae bacterium]|jgi:inosine-uridine nucleoside N-ribohydrolase|nr:nucleoside hydrolase [Synergistaceae bacterium]
MNKALKVFLPLTLAVLLGVRTAFSAEKVILDSDMVELFDDGVTMLMLANHPDIELLGVTVVAGNQWLADGISAAVRQLELAGLDDVPVAAGARRPMRTGRYEAVAPPELTGLAWSGYERTLFGIGVDYYAGAYSRQGHKEPVEPTPEEAWKTVYAANYGEAPRRDLLRDSGGGYRYAADFIVETVNKYPGEVTILAIGPCTNLQTAILLDPEIVPKVKKIIYMGGAINVAGNTTPAAEFNWWFDPEAAKFVTRAPWGKTDPGEEKITQYVVPLDVCEKVRFTHKQYDKIVNLRGIKPGIKAMFEKNYAAYAAADSTAVSYVWDAITAGVLIGEVNKTGIVLPHDGDLGKTGYMDWWLDVDSDYGVDYGRSLGYGLLGPVGTQKVRVVNAIDEDKFWELVYAGLDPTYKGSARR